jgi:hypothetical protein
MEAAKAFWSVTAGVITGEAMQENSRQWGYTSSEYEKDMATPSGQRTIFEQRDQEAHRYARSLTNPKYVNWVKCEFLWV